MLQLAAHTPGSNIVVHPSSMRAGLLLKIARLKLGFTQQMLADFAQVGKATVQRAEAGQALRPDTVYQLCQYFSTRYNREVLPEELGLSWEYRTGSLS